MRARRRARRRRTRRDAVRRGPALSEKASYREGAAYGLLTFGSLAVLGVMSGVVMARLFGVHAVGSFALAYAPVVIVSTLSTMQEGAAIVRIIVRLPRRHPRITALFVPVLAFSFALTTVVGAIVAAGAVLLYRGPVDHPELVEPMLVLLTSYLLLTNTGWNMDAIFSTFRAGRQLFVVRLLNGVVLLVAGIAVSFVIDSYWGIVVAQVASEIAGFASRAAILRQYLGRASRDELRAGFRELPQILRFGAKMAPSFTATGIAHEATTWVLGATSSVSAVGGWTRAWQLATRLTEPTHRIAEMLYPTLVERRQQGDREGFDRAVVESCRIVGTLMLLPAAVVGGAAHGVMTVYGPGFDPAAGALAIALLVPVLYCLTTLLMCVQVANDQPGRSSIITVSGAVVVVLLAIPMTSRFGVTGAAAAQATGWAADLTWRVVAVRRLLLPSAGRRALAATVPALLAATGAFAVARVLDGLGDGALSVVLALTGGTLVFVLLFAAAGGATPGDRQRVGALAARVRRTPVPLGGGA